MFPETPPIDKPVSLSQAATASRRTLATGLLLLQTAQGTGKSFPYVLRVAWWLCRATVQSICGKTECQSGCSHRTAIGARSCAHTLGAAVAHAVALHSSGPGSCPGCESRPCPWSSLPIQGSGLGHPCTCWPRSLGVVSKNHAGGPLSLPVSNQREVLHGLQEGSRCGKLPSPQAPQQCWSLHLPGLMGQP